MTVANLQRSEGFYMELHATTNTASTTVVNYFATVTEVLFALANYFPTLNNGVLQNKGI
jgi:hypothetical protein